MSGFGTPGRIRTCDLEIRSLPLYPAELRALILLPACASARQHTMGVRNPCQVHRRPLAQLSNGQRAPAGIPSTRASCETMPCARARRLRNVRNMASSRGDGTCSPLYSDFRDLFRVEQDVLQTDSGNVAGHAREALQRIRSRVRLGASSSPRCSSSSSGSPSRWAFAAAARSARSRSSCG